MIPFKKLSTLEKCSLGLAVALLACLWPLPYGFYTLVRLAVAIIAGCWAYSFFKRGKTAYAVVACAVVILFQPLFMIALDRVTWNVVDVILTVAIAWLVLARNSIIRIIPRH